MNLPRVSVDKPSESRLRSGYPLRLVFARKQTNFTAGHWRQIGLLAVVYFLATLLSRFFVIPPEILAPIWLPAGVLLAGLLWLPWSAMVPAVGAVFLASLAGNVLTHIALESSLIFSAANCLGGVLAAIALKRLLGPRPGIGELKGLVYLMIFGIGLANGVGAIIGAGIVSGFGYGGFGSAWIIWFLSNAWGMLIVVPLISEWGRIRQFVGKAVPRAWVELLIISVLLSFIVFLIWTRGHLANTYAFVAPFLIFPLLVWIALRFGAAGATVGSFALSVIVLLTTKHGVGRFAFGYESLHTRFVELQVFMTMATICSLVAAAIMADRDRAETSLRYASSIIESSDAAIIGKSLDGIITNWSPGAERLYGYSAREMLGQPISVLVPQDRPDEMPTIMSRLRRNERVPYYETVRQRKDGSLIDISLKVSPIYDKNGVVIGASSIARDITRQKEAERILEQTNERLELSFDAAHMGAWNWDFRNDSLQWFGKQESLFGFAPGTFDNRGESALARIHPDDIARVRSEINGWIAQKRAGYGQEFRVVWPDGSEHSLFAKGRLIYEGDQAVRCIGINFDVTERKAAETALRLSEERLARTQELSLVMPLHVSLNGEWLRVPPRFCEFLGYTHDELVGMPFKNVTHPDDFWADWSQCLRLIAGTIDSFEMEKRFIRKNGSVTWGYLNCSIVKDEAGKPLYFLTYVRDINQEKRAEEALRDSEERLRLLIEYAPAALAMFDRDMRYIYASQRWRSDYNLGNRDLRGLSHYEVFPEIPESWKQVHRRGLAGEVLSADGERLERPDGTVQWVRWEMRPWRDAAGNVGGIVIFSEDITERKHADEALRESEERFRTIFESAAVGMAQVALDGRWLRVNDRLCEITGYSREELQGKTFQEITHKDDLAKDLAQVERMVRGEITKYSLEKRYIHKDGHTVWVNVTASVQHAAGDHPANFISAVEDISERKRAEQALRKSEKRLRVLTEALPQLVWTADPTGMVDYVNRRWCAYTGQTRQQALGVGSYAAVHPDDVAPVESHWQNAVRTGTQYQMEFRLRSKDGQYRWFLARGVPLRNDEGQIERWFGTCTDIHEMKMAQQALIRSEKLASVGRMAMTIAHEINNPLAAVMNTLFLARAETGMPKAALRYLDIADGELQRISHITRQALGFYRESSTPQVTSLNELLDSVTELLKSKISAKHVNIEKKFKADVKVTAVAGELRQVFSNLLSNAIDAVDDGGRIRLRISRSVHDQHTARVTVCDNGHGITETALPHIFEPFFTTKDAVGTGLGLWVSKQIVDKHKGCIRVRSCAEGERHGTVFSVVLPLVTEGDAVNCPVSPAARAS